MCQLLCCAAFLGTEGARHGHCPAAGCRPWAALPAWGLRGLGGRMHIGAPPLPSDPAQSLLECPGAQALHPSVFCVDVTICVCPQASCGRFQSGLLSVSVSACREGAEAGSDKHPCTRSRPWEEGAQALQALGGYSRQEQARGGTGHHLPAPAGAAGLGDEAEAKDRTVGSPPGRSPGVGNRAVQRQRPTASHSGGHSPWEWPDSGNGDPEPLPIRDRHADGCRDPPTSASLGDLCHPGPQHEAVPGFSSDLGQVEGGLEAGETRVLLRAATSCPGPQRSGWPPSGT